MIRKQLSVLAVVALVAGFLGCAVADEGTDKGDESGKEENAVTAAGAWLELVDAGE